MMSPIQLKFIVPPFAPVAVLGKTFKISAVTCLDADAEGTLKLKSYFFGIREVGAIRNKEALRFSLKHWESLDDAYNAWWQGFTVAQDVAAINALISEQLISDGSAVDLSEARMENTGHTFQDRPSLVGGSLVGLESHMLEGSLRS